MASHKSYRHRPGRAARDDGSGDEDPVVFFEAEPPGLDDPESAIEAADPPAGTQSSPEPEGAPRDSGPRAVIAVGSGKGGAGKSLLAASMGVYLAQLGKKVVLVDANLGSANRHTMVGVEEP